MPRNVLTGRAREQIRILFGLLALRTVGFLFGIICILVLLACGAGESLCAYKRNICKNFNRIHRKGKYMNRRRTNRHRTPNDRFSPSAPPSTSQKEREDMLTLRGIFPALNIAELRQAYMRHKDVQQTVLELSE